MGILVDSRILSWEETKAHADHVRGRGIAQFLNLWSAAKTRKEDPFLWGDEVRFDPPLGLMCIDGPRMAQLEYMVIDFDDAHKNAKLLLCQDSLLPRLVEHTNDLRKEHSAEK